MKINRDLSAINPQLVNKYYQKQPTSPVKKSATQQPNIKLSTTAQHLVANAHNSETDGNVDVAKVEKIKEQLAAGTYQVSPEKIADKMFSEMKQAGFEDE